MNAAAESERSSASGPRSTGPRRSSESGPPSHVGHEGALVGDRYRLKHKIGRGGMGVVWAADDERLKREVAVKVMNRDPDESDDPAQTRSRFENEAMAAAKLRSPHVVQIYDYGIDAGAQYIVMERLGGEDLRCRLKRRKRLSLEMTGTIMSHTAKALSEAHAAGIVHRDLKPGNIFLSRHHDETLVKVLDFGVAKIGSTLDVLSADTQDGALVGTPQYMAPEQIHGVSGIDARADLFSLGVILFKTLTGQMPFVGGNPASMVANICTAPIPSAYALAPDLPRDLDDFFARALARTLSERFATARQMAVAFSRIVPISVPSLELSQVPPANAVRAGAADEDAHTHTERVHEDVHELLVGKFFDVFQIKHAMKKDKSNRLDYLEQGPDNYEYVPVRRREEAEKCVQYKMHYGPSIEMERLRTNVRSGHCIQLGFSVAHQTVNALTRHEYNRRQVDHQHVDHLRVARIDHFLGLDNRRIFHSGLPVAECKRVILHWANGKAANGRKLEPKWFEQKNGYGIPTTHRSAAM